MTEALEDGRLRIGGDMQGQNTRVVMRGRGLDDVAIKTGTEVRMEPNFRVALEAFPAKESQDFFLDKVTEIPWDKIGGQQEAIGVIKDAIELPLLYPELYERFGKRPLKGILLYGPPGCGKDADRQGHGLQTSPRSTRLGPSGTSKSTSCTSTAPRS